MRDLPPTSLLEPTKIVDRAKSGAAIIIGRNPNDARFKVAEVWDMSFNMPQRLATYVGPARRSQAVAFLMGYELGKTASTMLPPS